MIVRIDSPEFANAWRTVSESLLAFLQGGNVTSAPTPTPSQNEELIDRVTVSQPVTPQPPKQEKTIQDTRYANCPIRQVDGSYMFKNLKDEEQTESTYKIIRYSDGSCEFELCNLQGEARQIFKDNKANRMPAAVGTLIGEITAESTITTTKRGTGIQDGRSVKIIDPLEVEFK